MPVSLHASPDQLERQDRHARKERRAYYGD
jgi:hypothetical protein